MLEKCEKLILSTWRAEKSADDPFFCSPKGAIPADRARYSGTAFLRS